MYRNQIVGASLLALSAIMIIVYAWLIFLSPWAQLAVQLTAFLAVAAVFGILGWVDYTLATTPPPKLEAEVEKALGAESRMKAEGHASSRAHSPDL